ncbi:hypothetical protein M758_3G073100 [Ceratodon purpureus]|nr:hypothetical protein M758_3G073100 [Ceratodon purpureus]
MLVDKMEYQGQQGGGGAQDDAFYELLSSTALAHAKKQQLQQGQGHQQFEHQQFEHPQFEHPQQQGQGQVQQFGEQREYDYKRRCEDEMARDEVLPSYDFQTSSGSYGGGVSNGEEVGHKAPAMAPVVPSYPTGSPLVASRQHLPIPSFVETSPARQERGNAEAATVAAVEQTMKKYMDDLMLMMESVTGRIGQLESSTRRLEQMVTEFKGGSEKNQGASGSKLSLIENMLSEVQRGVQDLRNRQEVVEAQSKMGKLHLGDESISSTSVHSQTSMEAPPPQSPRAPQLPDTPPYSVSQPPHHPHHPHHPPGHPTPPPYMVPPQLAGLAPPPPPPVHLESHYPPSQQGPPPPPQSMQSSFYGQQQGPAAPPPPPAHAFSHQPELPPYGSTPQGAYKQQAGSFGQEVQSPYGNRPQQAPQTGPGGPNMYDQSVMGGNSGLLPPYQSQGRPAAPVYDQQQQMGGPPPAGYSNPGYRTGQQTPSAPSSGAGGYPRLPTAQPVQHAMATGREREGAAASSGATPLSTNRLSIDEVIDKVAVMGFSKDQVRAVVRRLTENGQSVDLNIVLDKLMNGEAGPQQPKGWFQRG